MLLSGGSSGAGGTPGEGFEGTVGGFIQQHHAQLALQQQSQLQQLQQLHHYQQQQFLQYQQQQVRNTSTALHVSTVITPSLWVAMESNTCCSKLIIQWAK